MYAIYGSVDMYIYRYLDIRICAVATEKRECITQINDSIDMCLYVRLIRRI